MLTTDRPIVVLRRLPIPDLSAETWVHGQAFDLLQSPEGERYGSGAFPQPSVLPNILSLLHRQVVAQSTDCSNVQEFVRTANFLCAKLEANILLSVDTDDFREIDRSVFDEDLASKTTEFRDETWNMNMEKREGLFNKKVDQNAQLAKYEELTKNLRWHAIRGKFYSAMKERGITVMKREAYKFLHRMHRIQHILYHDPILSKWMIKGNTPEELMDKMSKIIVWSFRSQDISGFEKGITHELRDPLENRLIAFAFRTMGLHEEAEYFLQFVGSKGKGPRGARKVSHKFFLVYLFIRCSGDFWTSLGNGLVNINIILTGHRLKTMGQYQSIDHWWCDASTLDFVTEGDDGNLKLQDFYDVASGLRMAYSIAEESHGPGGADFLKNVHFLFPNSIGQPFKMLNVVRSIRACNFVTTKSTKASKVLWLWRAKALSLLHLSPGHPILWALVERIGQLTSGLSAYKGWEKDFEAKWQSIPLSAAAISKKFPNPRPNADMRAALHYSTNAGSPAIDVSEQLLLEEQFLKFEFGKPITITPSLLSYEADILAMRGSSDDDVPRLIYDRECDPTVLKVLDGLVNGFTRCTSINGRTQFPYHQVQTIFNLH